MTSLLGARNKLGKVFIIDGELTGHRGHLILMVIKIIYVCVQIYNYDTLDNKEVIYCTVQSWVGSVEREEKHCFPVPHIFAIFPPSGIFYKAMAF